MKNRDKEFEKSAKIKLKNPRNTFACYVRDIKASILEMETALEGVPDLHHILAEVTFIHYWRVISEKRPKKSCMSKPGVYTVYCQNN